MNCWPGKIMTANIVGEVTKREAGYCFTRNISLTPHRLIRDVTSMVQRERAPQDTDTVSRGNLNPGLAGSHMCSEAGYGSWGTSGFCPRESVLVSRGGMHVRFPPEL